MREFAGNELLKGVSRSFYLTLRLLPAPMRRAASLAYLLARTSDTLADSAGAPVAVRLECLSQFERAMDGAGFAGTWPAAVVAGTADPRERRLLVETPRLVAALGELPAAEARLVQDVLAVIVSGQRLDLERFVSANSMRPVALADAAALDDYAWRVAGCVGEFWTRLGLLTLGAGFSSTPADTLIGQGITYGKGLQLVNILRDLPADLAIGRCYLPVPDPCDRAGLLAEHRRWLERADEWVGQGFNYAASLHQHRLRAASVLPAMIARETLHRLRGADWHALQARVKVPRSSVYLALCRALAGCNR